MMESLEFFTVYIFAAFSGKNNVGSCSLYLQLKYSILGRSTAETDFQ